MGRTGGAGGYRAGNKNSIENREGRGREAVLYIPHKVAFQKLQPLSKSKESKEVGWLSGFGVCKIFYRYVAMWPKLMTDTIEYILLKPQKSLDK